MTDLEPCLSCGKSFDASGGIEILPMEFHPWCAECCATYVKDLEAALPADVREQLLTYTPPKNNRKSRSLPYWSRRYGPGDRLEVKFGEGHPTELPGTWVPEARLVYELRNGVPTVHGMRVRPNGELATYKPAARDAYCVQCSRPALRGLTGNFPTCSVACAREYKRTHTKAPKKVDKIACTRCKCGIAVDDVIYVDGLVHPWCPSCIQDGQEDIRNLSPIVLERAGASISWWLLGNTVDFPPGNEDVDPDDPDQYPEGTLRINANGYADILVPPNTHHRADMMGWVPEWVIVAERELGYPMPKGMVARRYDGNRLNNKFRNLHIFRRSEIGE